MADKVIDCDGVCKLHCFVISRVRDAWWRSFRMKLPNEAEQIHDKTVFNAARERFHEALGRRTNAPQMCFTNANFHLFFAPLRGS